MEATLVATSSRRRYMAVWIAARTVMMPLDGRPSIRFKVQRPTKVTRNEERVDS
jgi:hypothetical protein